MNDFKKLLRVKRLGPHPGKKIWAFETGEMFDSIVEASKKTGANQHLIYDYVAQGKRCPRTGLTFKRVHV